MNYNIISYLGYNFWVEIEITSLKEALDYFSFTGIGKKVVKL
jgi:hypothetical protein